MSLLFDIKRYAINDGPGIRISLFYKGCPLSCVWCHNPEGIKATQEKMYAHKKCIGCGYCVKSCPQHALQLTPNGVVTDTERCTVCGICTEVCPTKAMELSGKHYTTEQLMIEIEKERPFMEHSNGGVTFCGGEPLMHLTHLLPVLQACRDRGVHRVIDTTLYASHQVVKKASDECDLFLVDLKHMNSELHKKMCGVPNEPILQNLQFIAKEQKEYYIRIPLIEEFNCSEENIQATINFLKTLERKPTVVNLLPYHEVAQVKHEKLGTIYNPSNYLMSAPTVERQQQIVELFLANGLEARIGG